MDTVISLYGGPYGLIYNLLAVLAFMAIYRRAGFRPWPAVLAMVPWFGLPLAMAPLAFRRWPAGLDVSPPRWPWSG